jgi:hypothetical protein
MRAALAAAAVLLLAGCTAGSTPAATPVTSPAALPPGALNPAVTQQTIAATVCVAGWTASIRPRLPTRPGFQHDHVVSLVLGGSPTDGANLWFQPLAQARLDDVVETLLARLVCKREMTLAVAQRIIVAIKHDEMR